MHSIRQQPQLEVLTTAGSIIQSTVPPHLAERPWLDFELVRALELCDNLSTELEALCRKPTAKRVHDSRVAMRRWGSVWGVLGEDGWDSRKYKERIERKIKKLRKLLGHLRDWDVNIDLGEAVGVSRTLLDKWQKNRKESRRAVKAGLKHLEAKDLVNDLRTYIALRAHKVRARVGRPSETLPSAYDHLDVFLRAQEKRVRELEMTAQTPEELHGLRLGIKGWRYLLTEFFGLTNLQLVRAQQHLGKLNDYNRLKQLLSGEPDEQAAVERLDTEYQRMLGEFNKIRSDLPYGLRPGIAAVIK